MAEATFAGILCLGARQMPIAPWEAPKETTLLVTPQWSVPRPAAYFRGDLPEKDRIYEGDMLQCKHCQFTWAVKPGSGTKRGWCYNCGGPTCGKPHCLQVCEHFMKAIERMEARSRFLLAVEED